MITVVTSLRAGYPIRFPIGVGTGINEIGRELSEDLSMTEWMLQVWHELNPRREDIIIYKHNDLQIWEPEISLHQIEAAIDANCDLVGVAGTDAFDPKQRRPNGDYCLWTEFTPASSRRGLVFHSGRSVSGWSYYGPPGRVKILDGCLLACSGRLSSKIEDLLSPKFHRHYYDLSFSFNVHRAGGRVYALCLPVAHESEGHFDANWRRESLKFYEYYDGFEDQNRGDPAEEPRIDPQ